MRLENLQTNDESHCKCSLDAHVTLFLGVLLFLNCLSFNFNSYVHENLFIELFYPASLYSEVLFFLFLFQFFQNGAYFLGVIVPRPHSSLQRQ